MRENDIAHELKLLPELESRLESADLTLVVSVSGGVDSIASLLYCIEKFPSARILLHHQAIPIDWLSTIPYIRQVAYRLNVEVYVNQAIYVKHLRQFKNGRLPEEQLKMKLVTIGADRDVSYDQEEAAVLLRESSRNIVTGVLGLAQHRNAPPTARIHFCTSYFKRACFDKWVRKNRGFIGANGVHVMGYRRLESPGRAKQPVGRVRDSLTLASGWQMYDFHPILNWTKEEAFGILKRHGIEPHIAYAAQGLDLSQAIPEGGPRMSCIGCIFSSSSHMATAVQYAKDVPCSETNHAREVIRRILNFQRASGMTWQQGGEAGLNTVAKILGEPLFRKEAGVPKQISLRI
jgi:3'-phosphoadenosine 5'-phosphosulfate sulfotransferase (PAPS reductase)/FAD synthetase